MSMFRLGLSWGHGGPRHSPDCAQGGKCDACGTKAGAAHGIIEGTYVRELGDQLYDCIPHDIVEVVRLNEPHETVSPTLRGQRARRAGVHLVLALHVNESERNSTHGAHMFHRPDCRMSIEIAKEIATGWPGQFKRSMIGKVVRGKYIAGMVESTDRRLYPRASWLVNEYAPVPCVLVEAFYASNPADCEKALCPWVQLAMVSALLGGISRAGRMVTANLSGAYRP